MGTDGVCSFWLLVYVENNEILCVLCKSLVSHAITKLTFADVKIFMTSFEIFRLHFFLSHKKTVVLFLHLHSPDLSPLSPLRILALNDLSYTWWAPLVLPDTQRPKVFFRVYKWLVNANSSLMMMSDFTTRLNAATSMNASLNWSLRELSAFMNEIRSIKWWI